MMDCTGQKPGGGAKVPTPLYPIDPRRSCCSARNQSSSAEPIRQPRSSQYKYARRAISSREGSAIVSEMFETVSDISVSAAVTERWDRAGVAVRRGRTLLEEVAAPVEITCLVSLLVLLAIRGEN